MMFNTFEASLGLCIKKIDNNNPNLAVKGEREGEREEEKRNLRKNAERNKAIY